ncbi:MAG: VCBS repeat-containing protein [Planctomycetes bacterium]|nr:VCBS repeat-containing protein [Planctomycetota bacterium]
MSAVTEPSPQLASAGDPAPDLDDLVGLLGSEDDRLALEASARLERMGEEAVPALERALREGTSLRRFRAARALSGIGQPAVPALAASLGEKDGVARYLASEALARMGPAAAGATDSLRKALRDPSRSVRSASARALAALGAPGLAVLDEALGDADEEVRSLVALALGGSGEREAASRAPAVGAVEEPPGRLGSPEGLLLDVTADRGIAFHNSNGATGKKYMVETVGFGAGWIDYDRDGYLDLYLVQGHGRPEGALDGPGGPDEPGDVLLRNVEGKRFEDVSEQAGVADRGYGMGVAAGDYDQDGYSDLYVTSYGRNTLYHNRRDGTFVDVTEEAGVGAGGWSTSASWVDLDGDRYLDLYVATYVEYDARTHQGCTAVVPGSGRRVAAYCDPGPFAGAPDVLYQNQRDGTFRDVTRESGIQASRGRIEDKGLGVVASDFDGDGDPDVLVANDKVPNTLWRNLGGMRFENAALETGFAFAADGAPKAGMGIAAGDVDGDGRADFVVTNFSQETSTLYLNRGGGFEDASARCGLGVPTYLPLGFGAVLFDLDLDGDLDLYLANGHVLDNVRLVRPDAGVDFGEPDLLLENTGAGRFRDISASGGAWFQQALVGRAVAQADYDNDGDPDLLVTNVAGPAVLLENRAGDGKSWIGIDLRSGPEGPVVEGARVEVEVGARTIVREVHTDGSYLSAHDPRVTVGLEGMEGPVEVRVRWPGEASPRAYGRLERGRYHVLRGDGE